MAAKRRMMRRLVAAIALAMAAANGLAPSATARSYYHRSQAESSYEYYTAKSGHRVHRPVKADRPPVGASARCRDGSYSFSESRRGTCSWHGGVASWL